LIVKKTAPSVFLAIGIVSLLFSCSKEIIRDNPYDVNNPAAYKGFIAFSRAVIYSDKSSGNVNTTNNQVNIGEHLQYFIYVKNTSANLIGKVTATIKPHNNPDILNIKSDGGPANTGQCVLNYGNIDASAMVYPDFHLDFDVAPTATDNERLIFDIEMADAQGHHTEDTFSVKVMHFTPNYHFVLQQAVLLSSNQSDGKIRAGANIIMGINVKNAGSVGSNDIKANVSINNSSIKTVTPAQLDFGNLASGANSKQQKITLSLANGLTAGTNVPLDLDIFDQYGNTWKQTINFTVSQ